MNLTRADGSVLIAYTNSRANTNDILEELLEAYLKHQLLQKLDRLTATVKIKRSPSKRLQGKMPAPAYRELERAINNMALSPCAHETGMAQLNSTSMPS